MKSISNNIFSFLLFFTVFLYFPFVSDPAQSPVFCMISLAAILHLILHFKSAPTIHHHSYISFSIIAYLLIAIFSLIFKAFNSESIYEFNRVLFFCFLYFFFLTQEAINHRIMIAFLLLGSFYQLFGYIEYFHFYNTTESYNNLYQIRAHIGHKNLLSMFLVLTFPISLNLFLRQTKTIYKVLILCYCLCGSILIFLVKSRVGILAFVVWIFLLVVYLVRIGKLKMNLVYTGFIGGLLFFSILRTQFEEIKSIERRTISIIFHSKEKTYENESIQERFVLWQKTISLIKKNPLIGVGLDQWKLFIPAENINATRAKYGNIIFQQPHNDLLWVTAELGIIGLLIYLFPFLYGIVLIVRNRFFSLQQFMIFSMLFIYLIISFFDFPKERSIFLCLLAFLLSMLSREYSIQPLKIKKFFLIFPFTLLSFFFIEKIYCENLTLQMMVARKNNKMNETIQLAEKLQLQSVEYDYTSTPIHFYQAEAYFIIGKNKKAIYHSIKGIQLNPNHLYLWNNLGSIYYRSKEEIKAVYSWNKAIELANDFAEPRINLTLYYLERKDYEMAEKMIHFPIQFEDIVKYQEPLKNIFSSFVYNYSQKSDSSTQSEIDLLKNDSLRLNWLIYEYGKSNIDMKKFIHTYI